MYRADRHIGPCALADMHISSDHAEAGGFLLTAPLFPTQNTMCMHSMAAFKESSRQGAECRLSAHLQADDRVLNDHALARLHAQALCGGYVYGRVGLFPFDVIAAQEYVKALAPVSLVRHGRQQMRPGQ